MDAASRLHPLSPREVVSGVADAPRVHLRVGAGAGENVTAEQALARAVQRGDRDAFAQLIEGHQRAVYGYVRARTLDAGHAEDITQEVFYRCLKQCERLHRGVCLRAWLIGIARNVIHEFVRKSKRSRERAWSELCLTVEASSTPDAIGCEDEIVGRLPTCLESLGRSAREALDLQYQSRLTLQQIGERLKRSEGAVKLLLYRARQALRLCLEKAVRKANR